eukprot:SAG11_NODE_919_length_6545_cov_5.571052_2_plen_157_part_00
MPVLGAFVQIISTGFSRELPGNTHAEECALAKLAERGVDPAGCDLYSTMEPCSVRLSGNTPCCPRIIDARIKRVFVGAMEPARFVECEGVRQLQDAGIEVIRVEAGANELEKSGLWLLALGLVDVQEVCVCVCVAGASGEAAAAVADTIQIMLQTV